MMKLYSYMENIE